MFKPYEGDEQFIFVSYSHKDEDTVLPIIADMCARGFRVWWDEGIDPGTEWPETIAEHLSACDVFLAMISDCAIASHNCRREINYAISLQKPTLCVFLRETTLTKGMQLQLGSLQQMMLYRYADSAEFYAKLYGAHALKNSGSKREQSAPKSADFTEADAPRVRAIERALADAGIGAQVQSIAHGPTVARFALCPDAGVRPERVTHALPAIAAALRQDEKRVRMEIPIPGTALIGLEVPNDRREFIAMDNAPTAEALRNNPSPTAFALGLGVCGEPVVFDLAELPHLLMAGVTGSGKTNFINCMLACFLRRATPAQVRLLLMDMTHVELSMYNDVPHMLAPVIEDADAAVRAFALLENEMMTRYALLRAAKCRSATEYNASGKGDPMPAIVVVIDGLEGLMSGRRCETEEGVRKLSAHGSVTGIHMVLSAQNPSVHVLTGAIKASIRARLAFSVLSAVDSRAILDTGGAEKLLGLGDMLFSPHGSDKPMRVQGFRLAEKDAMYIAQEARARG